MDYEKAYKLALERAKEELGSGSYNKGTIEYIFPELKESEDEKIKKLIIHALHGDVLTMKETNKALAWLEKQGECLKVPVTTAGSDFDIDKNKDLPLRKIFKPFDKVIVSKGEVWHGELVSYADPDDDIIYIVGEDDAYYKGDIMLYNDYTKHLIGKSRDK